MKKIVLTLADIFNLPDAVIYNPDDFQPISKVFIDSRLVTKGSLFIAIKGNRFDGHNFVNEAAAKGARAVVIHQTKLKNFDNLNCVIITVPDTTLALGHIASVWRSKLKASIIAITGSAGKTTTKEILATLLNEKFLVNKTISNNNNHIGVPLTILSTEASNQMLVAELGTNHFGEIPYTARIINPDYALITNIGSSHLEFLKNKKGVLKEESAIFKYAIKNKGTLIINNDDPLLRNYELNYKRRITFGFDKPSDINGKIKKYDLLGRPEIEIRFKNKKIRTILPVPGRQSALSYLAAVSVALKVGVNKKELLAGTAKLQTPANRLSVIEYKTSIIIDDTYNANPDSMIAAFDLLNKIKKHKIKTVVLGDMFELGEKTIRLHKKLSAPLIKNKIDEVYLIGEYMLHLAKELKNKNIAVKHFASREKLSVFLQQFDPAGKVILFKGSRGMKMEEFLNVVKQKVEANQKEV